jgi:putative DNA primase/helicase
MSKYPPTNFLKYIGTPFECHVLPIIPAGADISADSSLTAEHLGKIPGQWSQRQKAWYGFRGWQRIKITKHHLEKFQGWQAPDKCDTAIALALRLGELVAVDIDINKLEIADEVEARVRQLWGDPLCVRRREGSARRVMLYLHKPRTMPITFARVAFTCPQTGTEVNAVEIFGLGRQVVIEGPHAKGAMHYWLDGKGLTDLTHDELRAAVQLTTQHNIDLVSDLGSWIKENDWDAHTRGGGGAGGGWREAGLEAEEIMSPASSHRIDDKEELERLARAMRAIDLDDIRIDYDKFVALNRALCAVTGCDIGFLTDVVWPWVCTQQVARGAGPRTEDRGIDWLEEKWRGFNDSAIGAEYVYACAAAFGFKEGGELSNDTIASLYGAPADSAAGAGPDSDAGGAGASSPPLPSSTTSGPLPPRHSDVDLLKSFIERYEQNFRMIPEFGGVAGWQTLQNGLWVPAYPEFARAVLEHCSAVGDYHRRNSGKPGAGIDMAMKHGSTHARIERMLAKSPELVTPLSMFDSEPKFINTPGCAVDAWTLEPIEHNNSHLFRMCTLVTPDFGLFGPPEWWLSLIRRFGEGRDYDIEPILQRYFGYMFTGYVDWQLAMLIPGEANSGKTLIVKIIEAIAHLYALLKPPEFFVLRRNPDERFALDDIAGKRLLLSTETKDNSTWNETRLIEIIDGNNLSVEFKGGAKQPIPSKAKILISGNHEPRYASGDRIGGLQRRFMQLDIDKRYVLAEEDKDDTLLRRIIEKEGPQIMWWLIQGAHLALTEGRARFVQMAQPLLDAAREAYEESNPRRLWIEDRQIVEGDPNKDYLLLKSEHMDYQQFRQTDERGFVEGRSVFKKAMTSMFGWKWEKVSRGEPDKTKHGAMAVYGWKRAQAPITSEGLYAR